jgi:hypothetical protein
MKPTPTKISKFTAGFRYSLALSKQYKFIQNCKTFSLAVMTKKKERK